MSSFPSCLRKPFFHQEGKPFLLHFLLLADSSSWSLQQKMQTSTVGGSSSQPLQWKKQT
ncbi:hypothetical protein AAZX31_04G145100 [Glycine max]